MSEFDSWGQMRQNSTREEERRQPISDPTAGKSDPGRAIFRCFSLVFIVSYYAFPPYCNGSVARLLTTGQRNEEEEEAKEEEAKEEE